MSVIHVRVPATTANLGPGFDSVGLALQLYNSLKVEIIERGLEIYVPEKDRVRIPANENNYVYQVFREALEQWDVPVPPVRMIQQNDIPICSGLGSSSACVLLGLLAANVVAGERFSRTELLQLAAKIEGHPDNVLPAMLGGCVVGCLDGGTVPHVRFAPPAGLAYIIVHPESELGTSKARSVLPKQVPFADAVFNVGRASLLVAALMSGDISILRTAMEDKLHQPYRQKLIANWEEIRKTALQAGALNMVLSGAGPTILILCEKARADAVMASLQALQGRVKPNIDVRCLEADLGGAIVEVQ